METSSTIVILAIAVGIGFLIGRRWHKTGMQFYQKEIDACTKECLTLKSDLDAAKITIQELTSKNNSLLSLHNYHELEAEYSYMKQEEKRHKTAGLDYERYIGYLFEQKGYSVVYHGALRGMQDHGVDLVCSNDDHIYIVQCKNWNKNLHTLHSKDLIYLLGSSIWFYYQYLYNDILLFAGDFALKKYQPVLFVSYEESNTELFSLAKQLGVLLKCHAFDKRQLPIRKKHVAPLRLDSVVGPSSDILNPSSPCYDYVLANVERNPKFFKRIVQMYFPEINRRLLRYDVNPKKEVAS